MTCKDCICSEVCYYKSFNDVRKLEKRRNDVEKICKSFVHRDSLQKAPTVDAVEVVHGRWEEQYNPNGNYISWDGYYCSACGKQAAKSNYCPNCGADMRERKEEAVKE